METDQQSNIETILTPTSNTQSNEPILHDNHIELHSNLDNSIHNPNTKIFTTNKSEWEIITSTKRYQAWIPEQVLPDKETKNNIKFINLKFQHMTGFIRSKSVAHNKLKYICLEFSSMKALDNALKIEINNTHITNISPIPPTTTKTNFTVTL